MDSQNSAVASSSNQGWSGWSDIASSGIESNTGVSTSPQQNVPSQQGQSQVQEQPQNRESYFQSNWDKHASYWKQQGIEVKPDSDPSQTYQSLVEAYQIMNRINTEPEVLRDVARKMFPNDFIQPNYDQQIKAQLVREFGEDFQPNYQELLIPDSPSAQYFGRSQELRLEIKQAELQQNWQIQQQKQMEQQMLQQQYRQEVERFSKQYNLPQDHIVGYFEALKDPNTWSTDNLIKFARMVRGENGQPQTQQNQSQQPTNVFSMNTPPPGVAGLSGGGMVENKGFLADVF